MGKKNKGQKKPSPPEETPVKEQSADRKTRKKQPALQKPEGPNMPLTGLAVTGMLLTAYLALTVWLGHPPLYCKEGSSCDIVQRSRWGTFLTLPTAFWGFLTYTTLAYIGLRVRNPMSHWKSAWTVSMAGFGYSIYLIAISLFVIKATCVYCIVSFLIMAGIFGVVTFQRPKDLPKFNFTAFARQTVIITAVIIGGMHLHYSGIFDPAAGPEDPYLKGLAEHLTQDKAILYGAYW
ncbi:MAG: vitamin K epoxide reductase family protein [Nitrospirae bacterium]|nr:vitamin K epoxide reductase family protein [Nitrospirota bacterium]